MQYVRVVFLVTIFAQIFVMFIWLYTICLTVSLSTSTISAIIQILNLQSFHTVSLIFGMLLSVFEEHRRPTCWLSSISPRPSRNRLCYLKVRSYNMRSSPYTFVNKQKYSVTDFPCLTRYYKFVCCLIFLSSNSNKATSNNAHKQTIKRRLAKLVLFGAITFIVSKPSILM